ncbi:MAG TPA: NAD(P)-dependent oxidoreductase [Feifaniaceae bacterium]|nr:NAD(P)-dependent oxidoreductase [Feifaniaceae bacterium]
MREPITFLIRGKDPRNAYLAKQLQADGHHVILQELLPDTAARAMSVPCPCVLVLELHTPLHAVRPALESLTPGSACFAGRISADDLQYAASKGVFYCNLLDDDAFCVKNAIPTAEGALMIALQNTPFTIHESRLTLIGYGRVGKAVARVFRACGCRVTVASREASELADAYANGHACVKLTELSGALHSSDLVINTAPARLLSAPLLKELRKDTVIIELASGMDNIDLAAADALGLTVIKAGSLPGSAAPATAAEYLKDAILDRLKSRGEFGLE